MKKINSKKLQLSKIKIATLQSAQQAKIAGGKGTTTCVISREIACASQVVGGGCSLDIC